tara:strand:+ start:605 stop:1561 length:957 start_codon:yes stop_codon:yes gene_type:complete
MTLVFNIIKNKYFFHFLILSFLFAGKLETKIHTLYTDAIVEVLNISNNEIVGTGTGFFIDRDGMFVTNAHVIKNADEIKIITKDNKEYKVLDYYQINEKKDYAILKIDSKGKKFKKLHLGNSDKLRVGDDVIAVGNPIGYKYTITSGIVSSKRIYDNIEYIQIDADIAPGSSGGPLFDENENVIGITTSGVIGFSGLNFAIPINYIKKVLGYNFSLKSYKSLPKSSNLNYNSSKNSSSTHNYWESQEGQDFYFEIYLACILENEDSKTYTKASQTFEYCMCFTDALKFYYLDYYNSNTNDFPEYIWEMIDKDIKECFK